MADDFYAGMAGFADFAGFAEAANYRPLPPGWLVVVADIVDSTGAIAAGRYREINAIGAATIVALINALRPLAIPYQFGGDGALACIPAHSAASAARALRSCRQIARRQFGMQLRAGLVPIADLRARGAEVEVAKYQPHPHYQQAAFWGSGLELAERMVKRPEPAQGYLVGTGEAGGDELLAGFECRWNDLPATQGEVIALIVRAVAADADQRRAEYQALQALLQHLFGADERANPVDVAAMSVTLSPTRLSLESRIRAGFAPWWRRWLYLLRLQGLTVLGRWLMARGVQTTTTTDWGGYKQRLRQNSDYRKFDGTLRMILAGSAEQRRALEAYLAARRQHAGLVYGLHSAGSALVTCLVFDYDQRHVHFLDANDGGYAVAAGMLKQQLKGAQAALDSSAEPR